MDKITPCLWFGSEAEEAATFYASLFEDGRVTEVHRHTEASPGEPGTVLMVTFEIGGRTFLALNGNGAPTPFTEGVSLHVACEDQAEVDRLWDALVADGGEESQCAWLKDRWGVSWQIVPTRLPELLGHPDPAVADRVMAAMMRMRKIDVAEIERAAAG